MTTLIQSKDWAGRDCVLVNALTQLPMREGELLVLEGPATYVITGGRAPHKAGGLFSYGGSLTLFLIPGQ